MTFNTLRVAALVTLLPVAVWASDYAKPGLTQETEAQIRTTLSAQGYDVRKIDDEDGLFEAYAMKDGKRHEIYLDADMNIVKIELDD
ncbi:PepSY domain-containing protein [Shimia aestuarii]|uniref:Peptidase propeptide and YPEB domain-containing protein n=1 Tax=Shimia aestuarii TaxID=254406 RepID=A0A1I4S7W8_9RHOB|nr:PepSY domain-containing protein [Shimia aestuarii]SFM60363.1 Peptidase propeptide and YPEB domain-containing protein [Shimia aestuarii]